MPGRRALILGGTGVVGTSVGRWLADHGFDVTVTGRAATTRRSVRAVELDVGSGPEAEATQRRLLAEVSADPPDLVVDAVGRFAATDLTADVNQVHTLVWTNSFGRARLLAAVVEILAAGAALVRIESSIGDRPLDQAPVVSAAKGADSTLSVMLGQACCRRGVGFGALVVGAVRESLTDAEQATFAARTGAPAPTAADVAQAVGRLAQVVATCRLSVRMWLPDMVRTVDVMNATP